MGTTDSTIVGESTRDRSSISMVCVDPVLPGCPATRTPVHVSDPAQYPANRPAVNDAATAAAASTWPAKRLVLGRVRHIHAICRGKNRIGTYFVSAPSDVATIPPTTRRSIV